MGKGVTYDNTKALNLENFIKSALINYGYYIARCEAGINGTTASTENDSQAGTKTDGTSIALTKNSTEANVIVTKRGVGVWNNINQPNAAFKKNMSRIVYMGLLQEMAV